MLFFQILMGICIVVLIATWIGAIWDMNRRADMTGWQIAMWIVIIVLFPLIGLGAYAIFRPSASEIRYKNEVIQ